MTLTISLCYVWPPFHISRGTFILESIFTKTRIKFYAKNYTHSNPDPTLILCKFAKTYSRLDKNYQRIQKKITPEYNFPPTMSSDLTGSTPISQQHQIGDNVLLHRKQIRQENSNFHPPTRRLTYPELRFGNEELDEIIYGEKKPKQSIWRRILNAILCRSWLYISIHTTFSINSIAALTHSIVWCVVW